MTIRQILRRCRRPLLLGLCCLQFVLGVPLAQSAEDRGLLFRAGNVYLLGSVHMGKADFYPLRAPILAAFQAADALVVEVDVDAVPPRHLQAWIGEHGVYAHGDSLRNHLQPATWDRLAAYLRQHRVDVDVFAAQKPGLAVAALGQLQLQSIGYSSALGIDGYFLQQAHRQHKPIQELESIEQQMTLLSEFPNADLLIRQTLDEADQLPELMDSLIQAWKDGDGARLEQLLQDDLRNDPDYRVLYDQLYTQRNRAMTARIQQLLQSGRPYFVVVGAAHLLGEDGIVARLQRAGVEVAQL